MENIENKARLLDSLPECVFLVDDSHTVLAANARAETTLGADLNDGVRRPISDVFHFVSDSGGGSIDIDLPISRVFATGDAELLDG